MKKIILVIIYLCGGNSAFSQAGDCPALCVTTDIVATTAVDGTIDELNTTNGNCLSANEASSSYWYQVCFSSAGTFAFTMNPSGNKNDFDFALWTGTACPPTAAPARCSFAGIFPFGGASDGLTGLGNGATDNTEAASGDGWLAPLNVTNGSCITLNINNFGSGSDVFDLDFTGTATMTCVGTLPVSLINSSINRSDNIVTITWETASEQNNNYYSIYKSNDGINYFQINKISGSGNTSQRKLYSSNDALTDGGVYYYKVSQTDFDGSQNDLFIKSISYEKSTTINAIYNTYGRYLGGDLNMIEKDLIIIIKHKNGTYTKTIKR
tara:strand:- start:26 stop:997 length:972 start_codon:yes stop_codon:yes gene_type:complete